MDMNAFFATLPRGKEDKPLLFATGEPVYDFHDIDGLFFMLDRKLSGCMIMMWAKEMDPAFQGSVTLDGKKIEGSVLQPMTQMGGMWILGIPLRGHVTEYGKEYALHVEGYRDTDGNEMNPQDFRVKGIDRTLPDPANEAHEKVALEAAREGMVLLRNENDVLPLKKNMTLNLFGKAVHEFRTGAVGAGKISPRYSVSFVEAVRNRDGCALNEELVSFYGDGQDIFPPREVVERAKNQSDTAFIFLSRPAGENMDLSTEKGEYYLTDEEELLIRQAAENFTYTVVILNTGYPIDVSWAETYHVDALVYTGFAGMLAGPALLDILTGEVCPSGKLPDTWAKDYADIPSSRNFYDCVGRKRLDADCTEYVDTVYEEDIYVGYRYFETFGKEAAYPFGFGLSYTRFLIEPTDLKFDGKTLSMRVFVKNMGKCAGKEVVQIYIGKPDTQIEKPEKELVFFRKTPTLNPGGMTEFKVSVPAENLSVYSEAKAAYLFEAGEYRVYAGNSVKASLWGGFRVPETIVTKKVKNRMMPNMAFTKLSRRDPAGTFPKGERSGIVPGRKTFLPYAKRAEYTARFDTPAPEKKLTFADVQKDHEKAPLLAAQMNGQELARLAVCASAGWGMEGIGEAGSVFPVEGYGFPRFPVADGNSGVNLNIKNIGMPSGATICATWNTELCEEIGRVIGEEAKALGIPMILAPALNIHRNPLNGRQPEYFSEDPYLAGMMAGMYSRGMEESGTASCMKHLIANNCESSRKRNQSVISERAIREIYFKAFEYAMQVHIPAAVMTAYNAVNGVPTAADPDLLQGLLREENGFDGFIMTDWTTYDTVDVAAMVNAGNCWLTPGSLDDVFTKPILEGVRKGKVRENRLRENAMYMIRVMARFS